jgi:hypothetical protein
MAPNELLFVIRTSETGLADVLKSLESNPVPRQNDYVADLSKKTD